MKHIVILAANIVPADAATSNLETSAVSHGSGRKLFSPSADYFLFSILAQVSFSATVRLKTGFPGAESGSAQKYPRRSN